MLRSFWLGRPATLLLLPVLLVTGGWEEARAQQDRPQRQTVAPARPGDPFPPGVFHTLNPEGTAPATIDLAQLLGKKSVLLYYWIAGHSRSEEIFLQIQKLCGELDAGSLAVYGVAAPRPELGADAIRARIRELGIQVPVLQDDGFKIGTQLSVRSVPNITLIDREGILRLTNAASLVQDLEYQIDVEAAIRRVAKSGTLVTYGFLEPYFPVKELEGQPCPDFRAPLLADSVEQRYHSLLDKQKLNVLIFWSVDCSHCRKSLPEINAWLKEHPGEVNVISAANVANEASKVKTREFCKLNDFRFPTLVDQDARIGQLYHVTSTPTILIIGPDGVVDSAITSTHTDFGTTIRARQQKLLPPRGS